MAKKVTVKQYVDTDRLWQFTMFNNETVNVVEWGLESAIRVLRKGGYDGSIKTAIKLDSISVMHERPNEQ